MDSEKPVDADHASFQSRRHECLFDCLPWSRVVIDVTDIIRHFEKTTRVSGIQRVVVQLALSFFAGGAGASAFDDDTGQWRAVDTDALVHVFETSRSATLEDTVWRKAIARLHSQTSAANSFLPSSLLLSLGANWDSGQMFMAVRQLQASVGLTYAVLIHDTVPLKFPELCSPSVAQAYKRWLAASVENADVIITTSNTVEQELRLACSILDLMPRALVRCPLIGTLDQDTPKNPWFIRSDIAEVLTHRFVLFVGTIEPRKDHLFILDCWRDLISQLGVDQTPTLVIVGSLGWGYESVLIALQDPNLKSCIRMFTDLSDNDLMRLYDKCIFTVYNSLHEGWGLPVTESISRGRVPLVPQHSGLLESGANAAVYFTPSSSKEFVQKALRLITDPEYLRKCESYLISNRRLKSWLEIAKTLCESLAVEPLHRRRPVRVSNVYRFSSDFDKKDLSFYAQAEALRFSGFHQLEYWGVWTSALEFTLSGSVAPEVLSQLSSRDPHALLVVYLVGKVYRSQIQLNFFANMRRSRDATDLAPGRFCLEIPIRIHKKSSAFTLSIRQSCLDDLSDLGDRRAIGVGLEAFMMCDPSDVMARIEMLEYFSGYRTIQF